MTRTERLKTERDDRPIREIVSRLIDSVDRLAQIVSTRLEPPASLLRINEAAKRAGCSVSTLRKISARGVFTDHRRGKGQGSMRTYYADEIDAYRHDGERGVGRIREELGRL